MGQVAVSSLTILCKVSLLFSTIQFIFKTGYIYMFNIYAKKGRYI